jgi:type II secretory pathway component PulF
MRALRKSGAWPIVSIVVLVGLGLINIFLSLDVVPKFQQIYQEALPGMPLPALTNFIITARYALAFVALTWPIVGIVALGRRHRAATWIINIGDLCFFLLVPVTTLALFMPMTGGMAVGMSDAPLTNAASSH